MGKRAWGPSQLVSQGVPMPLLQGGPWARGPCGLEGSFPLWAPACPSGPSGVTWLPLFLAAASWGWAAFSPHLLPPSHSPVLTRAWPDGHGVGGLWVGRAGQERVGSSVLPQRLGDCSGAGPLPGPRADTCNHTALGLRSCPGVRPRVRPRPEQPGGPWQGAMQPSPGLSAPSPHSAWRSSP